MKNPLHRSLSLLAALYALAFAPHCLAEASASVQGQALQLSSPALSMGWRATADGLTTSGLVDHLADRKISLAPDAFSIALSDGTLLQSSHMSVTSPPRLERLAAEPGASTEALHHAGWRIVATLEAKDRLRAEWRAELRDGSDYVRQELVLTALASDQPISSVRLIDATGPDMRLTGNVKGSPLASGNLFLALEHPAALARLAADRGTMEIARELPLKAGQSVTYSSVYGTTAPGQLRRGFLAYLERERAHPYRTFLHYNSWYDIGYFTKYDQADALDAIEGIGQELNARRGVKLDSYLFDDGWDDRQGKWAFHSGFPDGFGPIKAATAKYGAAPGIWLSPWGGYGKPKTERLEASKALGLETNPGGLVLSGPKYFALFDQATEGLVRNAGINQFKIDGTGNADSVYPGSPFDSDFQAAISLIAKWRTIKPDLFINLTTGTYPSPFWLKYADSIWRGGEDHQFLGVGSWRQRWITYRDADTYSGVVSSGQLYPLNALMLHGIIYARHAKHLSDDPANDFTDEVRSYFASGTQLQELYVSHSLLTPANWDALAEAAKWSRANADTLKDSHWIGGDPGQLEVYGWGSWSPAKGIITLRNPGDRPQGFSLDVGSALELPRGAARRYRLSPLWASGAARRLPVAEAGKPVLLTLNPFEVLTLEAVPTP
jgi:hypothetical protein